MKPHFETNEVSTDRCQSSKVDRTYGNGTGKNAHFLLWLHIFAKFFFRPCSNDFFNVHMTVCMLGVCKFYAQIWLQSSLTHFNTQLVHKPNFGKWILLFGSFGQIRAVRKKNEFLLATFKVGCSTFHGRKRNEKTFYIKFQIKKVKRKTSCIYNWGVLVTHTLILV